MRDPENPEYGERSEVQAMGWKARKIYEYLVWKQSKGLVSELKRVDLEIKLEAAGNTATFRPIFEYSCPQTRRKTLCILRGGKGGSAKSMATSKRIWMIEGPCKLEVYGIGMGGRKDAYLYDSIVPDPMLKKFFDSQRSRSATAASSESIS